MKNWTTKGKLGKSFVMILVFAFLLQLTVVPPVLGAGEDFTITDWKLTPPGAVEKGETILLTLELKNNTSLTKTDLEGSKVIIDPNSSFYLAVNNAQTGMINWRDANASIGDVSIPLTYDGGSRTEISITVEDKHGNSKTVYNNKINPETQAVTIPDMSSSDTSKYVPILSFANNTMTTAAAGDMITVTLNVKNTGIHTAKNIRIRPEFPDNTPFTLEGSNLIQSIDNLFPDGMATVNYGFRISPYAEEKVYPIKFNFEYYNYFNDYFGGSSSPRSDTIYIKVVNGNSAPRLSVGQIRILTQEQVNAEKISETELPIEKAQDNTVIDESQEKLTLNNSSSDRQTSFPDNLLYADMDITNLGTLPARNIKVTLLGLKEDGFGLYQDTNLKTFDELYGGEGISLRYALLPSSKLNKGNYALSAKIEYQDQQGTDYAEEHQFFVPIENAVNSNSVPKIILNQYSCDPAIVKAGETFSLNLSFMNTSKDKTVSNIKIYFTVPDGGANSSGSVFTPVNSSNTFFIDSIEPKGTYYKTLQFYTIPDATPKTYTLTANFEYEDESGTEYKATELIGVPVNQQIKIETSEIVFPPEVFLGEPLAVSMDFYNTGKAKLSNLMIKLEGEFDTQNANYYVGNFDVGSSDYYEGMIFPNAPGPLSGAVVISYDEPSGEHVEVRKEFSVNVVEMPMPEMPPDYFPEDMAGPSNPIKTYAIIGVAVLAAVIAAIVVYKKVIKKVIARKKGIALDE